MTESVYLARSMPVDESEPIYAFRIGETIEAARRAIEDATRDVAGVAVINLEWDGKMNAETHGWYFQVDEYDLHTEEQ